MHRSDFLKALKEDFPNLTEVVNRQKGLLHFEVGEFRKFTQDAIRSGDTERTTKCFSLAERAYLNGNEALKNAIDVSFVEELEFNRDDESGKHAWEILPPTLKKLYTAFHG